MRNERDIQQIREGEAVTSVKNTLERPKVLDTDNLFHEVEITQDRQEYYEMDT
jgi:hypothetical protein